MNLKIELSSFLCFEKHDLGRELSATKRFIMKYIMHSRLGYSNFSFRKAFHPSGEIKTKIKMKEEKKAIMEITLRLCQLSSDSTSFLKIQQVRID